MIGAAIQSALEAVITNTYSEIAEQDMKIPFCVHSERESPVRYKDGTVDFQYEVEVFIVDETSDSVKALSNAAVTALEALTGTTYTTTTEAPTTTEETTTGSATTTAATTTAAPAGGITIDQVSYEGDEPGYDQQSKLYGNSLRFIIEVSNN